MLQQFVILSYIYYLSYVVDALIDSDKIYKEVYVKFHGKEVAILAGVIAITHMLWFMDVDVVAAAELYYFSLRWTVFDVILNIFRGKSLWYAGKINEYSSKLDVFINRFRHPAWQYLFKAIVLVVGCYSAYWIAHYKPLMKGFVYLMNLIQ